MPTERTAVGIMSPEARTSSNLAISCDNLEDGWMMLDWFSLSVEIRIRFGTAIKCPVWKVETFPARQLVS